MNRYTDTFTRLMEQIDFAGLPRGVGIIDCPEPDEAAAALAERLGIPFGELTHEVIDTLQGSLVVRLPADDGVLDHLNGLRDNLRMRRVFLAVALSLDEQPRFQRLCGDIYSARAFFEILPFISRTDVSLEAGRAQLLADHRQRLQKLDLRGFIRREQEDVSWTLRDVFVIPRAQRTRKGMRISFGEEAPTESLEPIGQISMIADVAGLLGVFDHMDPHGNLRANRTPQPFLLLGEPGGGKSFLLRWAALHDGPLFGRPTPLPVLISLAAFAQAPQPRTLWQYCIDRLLDRTPLAAHALTAAAEAGHAVFLLDGLDEAESESAQKRVRKEIEALQARAPRCLVLVTSRPTHGRDLAWPTLELLPFEDDQIRTFLAGWCALYAAEVRGPQQREAGRAEGEALAEQILAHDRLRQLAGNPLMLTILAIVNRRGLRLPDHRVELYQQVSEVLVEKWNRLRALEPATTHQRPLSLADALRILGPVALELVESGHRGDFEARALHRQIQRVQTAGKLTHLGPPDRLVALFRDTLGLIVEHAPGQYRFLHSMLLEFFAAHELVRTGKLETWAEKPQAIADQSQRHEPFLLALGILSQLRAEDDRVEAVLERVVAWLEGPLPEDGWFSDTFDLMEELLAEELPWGTQLGRRAKEALVGRWLVAAEGRSAHDVGWMLVNRHPDLRSVMATLVAHPERIAERDIEGLARMAKTATWMDVDAHPLLRLGLALDAPAFLMALTRFVLTMRETEDRDKDGEWILEDWSETWIDGRIALNLKDLGFTCLIERIGERPVVHHTFEDPDERVVFEHAEEAGWSLSLEPPPAEVLKPT